MSETDRYYCPYEDKLAGETVVEFHCAVAASDDEQVSSACNHDPEIVELDASVSIDDTGTIHLPGRPVNCPDCGNPYEFYFNGLAVTYT